MGESVAMHTLPVDGMQPDLQLYYSAFCRLPVNGVQVRDLGAMNVECTFCGALHEKLAVSCNSRFVFGYILTRLQASPAANPLFGSTRCLQGDVELEPFRLLPQFLRDLLHRPRPEANEFRAKLRGYNSAFAFTSINCNTTNTTNRGVVGGGPMNFHIHTTLFHRTGPLENRTPAVPDGFAQLYFHDPAFATDLRVAFFEGWHASILIIDEVPA